MASVIAAILLCLSSVSWPFVIFIFNVHKNHFQHIFVMNKKWVKWINVLVLVLVLWLWLSIGCHVRLNCLSHLYTVRISIIYQNLYMHQNLLRHWVSDSLLITLTRGVCRGLPCHAASPEKLFNFLILRHQSEYSQGWFLTIRDVAF